ncbi:MAG: hypothetical protein IIA45_00065 [Bacteroidetes bacterium]|nr:hypothetical protein [Bacteroidota bacterium]
MRILLDNGVLFSSPDQNIPQIFNGIPRYYLYGTYDISLIWFKIFGLFYGYIFNKLIMCLIAFVGMFSLLKKIIQPKDSYPFILVGVSLVFALLPFWSFTLSVCGLPLALYAFLNIRDREKHPISWLIIILFPFYSSLILSGVFFIGILILILGYDIYKNKTFNIPLFLGIGVFSLLYVVSHYPIFYSFLSDSALISHRVEMNRPELNLAKSYNEAIDIFRFGQYHAHSLHEYIIYPVTIVFILQFVLKNIDKKYTSIFIFIALTSVFYGFINWEVLDPLTDKIMVIIPIQLDRFHFLHPMFWYLLLGISLTSISTKWKFGKLIAVGVILFQLGFVFSHHEIRTQKNEPTYHEFYAEELFEEIKQFISKPIDSYRVISIGIHPSIAQYNGFYTLDGYFNNYPLEYKHQFRKVISNELDKDDKLKSYFDNWGSRCYAFSAELGQSYLNPRPTKINNLDFDFKVLKQMGGEYIISSAEIDTKNEQVIQLQRTFEHPNSYWQIHLYKVN